MQVKLCICMITYMYTAKRCAADSAQCQPRYTYMYLRTETHFQVVSRQAQAQVQGNKQKKRQSTADDIRVLVKHTNHKTGICPAVGNTAEGVWGERERETKIVHPLYVRRNESHASFFFCFRPPFSHHSHTNGVNKAFFPSGATTYAAVLALRPGTEPCDHHHVSLEN